MKSMGRMERIVIIISIVIIAMGIAYAGTKTILQLTEETAPTSDDLLHLWEVTGAVSRKVTIGNLHKGLEATLLDIADGTIDENLVNTANPWADDEVADTITVDLTTDPAPAPGGPWNWNNKVVYDSWTAFADGDTSPNVSAGSYFKTANSGATTIADLDDTDDHGDFQDGRLVSILVNDANTTWDFTSSELAWASQGSNDYVASTGDVFIFQYDSTRDGSGAGWQVVSGPMPSVVSVTAMTIPWGDADAALDSGGDIHFNETDEQLGIHSGDSGEVSGELALSVIQHFSITFDPDAICDGTTDRLALMTVGDDAPEGIIIDEWKLSFLVDPGTEFGAGHLLLKRADAFIGVANAATIDDLATTNGASSEDTDANINGGAAVANGKVIYLEFATAYTVAGEQVIFEMWYHAEED